MKTSLLIVPLGAAAMGFAAGPHLWQLGLACLGALLMRAGTFMERDGL